MKLDRRWTWHYRALMRLNGQLIGACKGHERPAGGSFDERRKGTAGSAEVDAERDILIAELAMEENALAEVEAALQRIRDGRYGVCEATGRPISSDRLRAIPWTRFSREAAPRHKP